MNKPFRYLSLLIALVSPAAPLAAQSVWSVSNGNWNATASWSGGVLPVSGPGLHLRFNATGAYTSTNNLGPMVLNRLTINNTSNATLTLAAATGNTLSFQGTNPTLDITGTARFTGWLTGSGVLTKTGTGTFIHDSDNTAFTGTLVIDQGRFSNWGGTSTSATLVNNFNPVSIVVNNGAAYQFGNAGIGDPNLPTTTYITANDGGLVSWQESQAFGGIHLQGGTLDLIYGNATANGSTAQTWTHGTVTGNPVTGTAYSVAGSAAVNKTSEGTVTLTGATSINSTGGLKIMEGTVVMTTAANLGTAPLTFGGSNTTGTLEYYGASATRGGNLIRATEGTGIINVANASTVLTLSGAHSGSGILMKNGPGTLHLTGALSDTGITIINEGTLRVNSASAMGSFDVMETGELAVNLGSLQTPFSVPTLNLLGGTAVLSLELNSTTISNQPLVNVRYTDGFYFSETAILKVKNAQNFAIGTYILLDYEGLPIESGLDLKLAGRTTGTLNYDVANTRILLNVTGTDTVKWSGAINSLWDAGTEAGVGGTPNWQLVTAGTATNYIDTDRVTFDDSAASFLVELGAAVQPQSVVVNAAADYTFSGAGKITGAASLSKGGSGTLVLATDNDYSGGTTVTAGTLQLGNGGAQGSFTGGITLTSGSTLAFNRSDSYLYDNTTTLNGQNTLRQSGAGNVRMEAKLAVGSSTLNLNVNGSGSLDMVGAISGTGVMNKQGSGQLNLLGGHSFTGTLNIHGGTVQLTDRGESGDLNSVSIVVNNSGTFIFGPDGNPDLPSATVVTINQGGLFELRTGESYGGFVLNGGEYRAAASTNTGVNTTAESAAVGNTVYDLRSGSITTAITGTGNGGLLNQSNGGVMAKTTSGTVTMGAGITLAATMPVLIKEGVLAMLPGNIPATGTATVSGGALAHFELGSASTQGTWQIYGNGSATSSRLLTLQSGGGSIDVVESGSSLTLTGALSGSGPLLKSGAGTLNLTGTLGSTGTITVASGLLRVKPGTMAGALTVQPGSTLAVASDAVAAALNLPTLSLEAGSTVKLELSSASLPGQPLINVTGSNGLTSGGNVLIQMTNSRHYATGQYTLLDYAGSAITSGFTLQIEGRAGATLGYDSSGTKLVANITQAEEVRWTGAADGTWSAGTAVNVGGSMNWLTTTSQSATNFLQTDFVHFDDSASRYDLTLSGELRPNNISVNAASDYTFAGTGKITGPTALTKTGSGTLILATDNDYTGGTTLGAGVLQIGNGGSQGGITGPLVINGGSLAFNRSSAYTLTSAVTTSVPLGIAQNGTGDVTMTSALALGANALTVTGTGNLRLSGVISGTHAQPVVMNGSGTLYLPATNTFTGTTVINSGTVSVATNRGLGDANADVIINGGTLQLTASNLGSVSSTARSVTIGSNGGILDFWTNQTFSGNGFFGTGNVVKKGPGEWAVGSNGSTFSGEILVQEGRLMMTSAQLNSAKNLTVAEGAQFAINDDAAGTWSLATGGKFTFSGEGPDGTGALRQYNGSTGASAANFYTTGFNREVVLQGANVLVNTVAERGTILITSNVTGSGMLTKIGPGTLTLSGNGNAYAGGTTINGGTLIISNTTGSGTGTGSVWIGSSGKLMGTGRIGGATTIATGGSLQPGTATARGTLTFDQTVTLQTGSVTSFRLTANGANDLLVLDDLFVEEGASLQVLLGYSPAEGDSFDLIDWAAIGVASTSSASSDWAAQLDFSQATLSGSLVWDTSLFNSQGIISVALAPEPSRMLLLALGSALLLARRRRQA